MYKRFCRKIQEVSKTYSEAQAQPITVNVVRPVNNRDPRPILFRNILHRMANPCLASLLIAVMSYLFISSLYSLPTHIKVDVNNVNSQSFS